MGKTKSIYTKDREYLLGGKLPKVVCRWPHGSSGNVQNERLSVIDPIHCATTVHPTREARVVRVKGGEERARDGM